MNEDPFPFDHILVPDVKSGRRVAGVLAVTLAVLLTLAGLFTSYKAALEPFSHAEAACARHAGPNGAETPERHRCVVRVAAEPPWFAGRSLWSVAAVTVVLGIVLIAADSPGRDRA